MSNNISNTVSHFEICKNFTVRVLQVLKGSALATYKIAVSSFKEFIVGLLDKALHTGTLL